MQPTGIPLSTAASLKVDGEIAEFRPQGKCDLITAVDLISRVIVQCREQGIGRLFVDARGLTGLEMPSLVDRFLMAEEWAQKARSQVAAVLVVHAEYIHPKKFGVMVARDFGMKANVFASETEARDWLLGLRDD